MRIQFTLLDPASGRADNLVLTADPETPLDDVAAALNQIQRGPLYLGATPLSGKGRLGDSGLCTGDTVTVGKPRQGSPRGGWPAGSVQLAAVGGPSAGRRLPIGSRRQVVIGRGQGADFALHDDLVSRRRRTQRPAGEATVTRRRADRRRRSLCPHATPTK